MHKGAGGELCYFYNLEQGLRKRICRSIRFLIFTAVINFFNFFQHFRALRCRALSRGVVCPKR